MLSVNILYIMSKQNLTLNVEVFIIRIMYLRKEQKTRLYKLLAERIKAKRQGMSQEDVAKRIGVSRTTLINIESGDQSVPLHVLLALAHVFQCRLEDLLPQPEEYEKVDMMQVRSSELPPETARVVSEIINKEMI